VLSGADSQVAQDKLGDLVAETLPGYEVDHGVLAAARLAVNGDGELEAATAQGVPVNGHEPLDVIGDIGGGQAQHLHGRVPALGPARLAHV
jgi:hypothetical protein